MPFATDDNEILRTGLVYFCFPRNHTLCFNPTMSGKCYSVETNDVSIASQEIKTKIVKRSCFNFGYKEPTLIQVKER